MHRLISPAVRWVPLIGLLVAGSGPALAQIRTPIAVTVNTVAAPAALTAVSDLPTHIWLTWPNVAGATGYKVTYTNNAGMPETLLYEGKAGTFAIDPGMCTGGMNCQYAHSNVSLDYLYSYRVYAFANTTLGTIYSDPGPVASAKSVPFVAPANLTYAVAPSVSKPGQLAVTVSWQPVGGAVGYAVVGGKGITAGTVNTPSVRFEPLRPKTTYSLCVSTIYSFNIADPTVKSCLTMVL